MAIINILLFLLFYQQLSYCQQCKTVNFKEYHFGTKTPYRFIANYNDSTLTYKGCSAQKIVGIIRHGTRTPGIKVVSKMKTRLPEIKDIFIDGLIESKVDKFEELEKLKRRLTSWELNVEREDEEKILAQEGQIEMVELAQRLQKRFPQLLKPYYSNSTYYFRSTSSERTVKSAKYFTDGLFGRKGSRDVWFPLPLDKDPILRFYKLCSKWREEVKKNPQSQVELSRFVKSTQVYDLVHQISQKIGNHSINYNDVHLMFLMCCFETAWHREYLSPWCSFFSDEHFKTLEFAEDLKYYWRDGYGYGINYNQACPLMKNIFDIFGSTRWTNVFYFTHSGTILKLLSHLGLYKDDFQLTAQLPDLIMQSRKWTTSRIDAFGSNIIFILYNCGGEQNILLLHQERVVHIPGCPKHDLCPLLIFKQIFAQSLHNCQFAEICSVKQ